MTNSKGRRPWNRTATVLGYGAYSKPMGPLLDVVSRIRISREIKNELASESHKGQIGRLGKLRSTLDIWVYLYET